MEPTFGYIVEIEADGDNKSQIISGFASPEEAIETASKSCLRLKETLTFVEDDNMFIFDMTGKDTEFLTFHKTTQVVQVWEGKLKL